MAIKIKEVENLRISFFSHQTAIHFEAGNRRYHIWMIDINGNWLPSGWIYSNDRDLRSKTNITRRLDIDAASNNDIMTLVQKTFPSAEVVRLKAHWERKLADEKVRMEEQRQAELKATLRGHLHALAMDTKLADIDRAAFKTLAMGDDRVLAALATLGAR